MIAWPDFSRDAAGAMPAGDLAWPMVGSRRPASSPPEAAITDAPLADEEPHPPAEAALDGRPEGRTAAAVRRRRWPLAAAVAVSFAAHAALAFWLAERISRAGVEAESDAISVEIVLEEAEPAAASVAGNSADSSEGEAEGLTTPPTVVAEEVPPDETVEEVADEAVSATPVEPDDAVERESEEADRAMEPPVDALEPRLAETTEPEPAEAARPAPSDDAVAESPSAVDPSQGEAQPAPSRTEAPEVLASEREAEAAAMGQLAEDIPLELVPAPMPRPEPPNVRQAAEQAQRAVPDKPRARREDRSRTAKAAETPVKPAARKRAERTERGRPVSAPAKARTTGNAARSASSAGATAAYSRKLNGHIQRYKRYPAEAARQRQKGAVRIAVTIDRSGRLSAARLAGASGYSALDREALATARRASPYPRPPDGVGGRTLTLNFTLRFDR